jgi:hypothetical protein
VIATETTGATRTVLWPKLRTSGAMSIAGQWELATITAEDLVSEAVTWPLERERARQVVAATADATLTAAGHLEKDTPLARHVMHHARALLT